MKPIQKERENRSAEKKDLQFHPYRITPETANTSVLLLESAEPEILCQTLRALTKFAAQDFHNRHVLFKLNAVHYILPHINHHELNIRRFALKALAQLSQLPQGPEQILADPANLRNIAFMLTKVEDVFVLEFASLILSELTKEALGCEQLISANILNTLLSRMKNSVDPDVQKNCLQTLSNLLDDPICASEVTKNQQFSWIPILDLVGNKFQVIQLLALRTVEQLLTRHKDALVQKTFKASTGVLDLCNVLETYDYRDIHAQVLAVLKKYVETEDNASHLYQSGCILRLLGYLDVALPALKSNCLAVLANMTTTKNGREALFETGTDMVFCHQLMGSNVELLADAAIGVANMTKVLASAIRMANTNIIDVLCGILSDDGADWFYVRINALKALVELCRIIPEAAYTLVEPKTFATLRNINRKLVADTPLEAQRLAVQCYINLVNYHESCRAMTNIEFIQELLIILQRPDITLKIQVCEVLRGLATHEDVVKEYLTELNGEAIVYDTLHIEHVGLRTAACGLIAASVTDEAADVYLQIGALDFMFSNKAARFGVSAWEAALEAIFKHHCSAKFAYTNRLDIHDFTQDGFYVLKRPLPQMLTLEDIFRNETIKDPVLVSSFHTAYTEESSSSLKERRLSLPDDHNLRRYLEKMRHWFGDPSKSPHYFEIEDAHYDIRYRLKCSEVSTALRQRAHLLGEFVARQMCGLTQDRDCSVPSADLHLAELVMELKCPVVGIGWIRVGTSLERAVLYKVLSDRIGLPCSLHRRGGNAWCEVALPDPDKEEQDTVENFPAGFLRANYLVDLMDSPGTLHKLYSYEANKIIGNIP